jgi:serine/threonine protein kinase
MLHIPLFYGEKFFNGQSYIIMECINFSIDEYIEHLITIKGVCLERAVIELAKQMLEAVLELHGQGILH